jgi:hypothetical protein
MSSIAFSGSLSNLSGMAQAASTGSASFPSETSTGAPSQPDGGFKDDTVKLSLAAQAKMMHRQGLSPAVIAANLGTNVKTVDSYLNLTASTTAALAAATSTTGSTSTTSTGTTSTGTTGTTSTATTGTTATES